jgi:hypothetical protein
MADPAVVSVVATGTVGVLGAAFGALNPWFTRKSQVEERLEGRRNDFRAVLDEAAGVLGKAVGTVEQVSVILSSEGFATWDSHVADSLVDDVRAVRAHSARLGVRLGPSDPIYDRYNRALRALAILQASLSNPRIAREYAERLDAPSIENWILTCQHETIENYAAFQASASARMGVPEG